MTEWTSPRLAQAYDLIATEIREQSQPAESPITEALARALTAVEEADCELELAA